VELDVVYTVMDTGPAVKGRLLDLYVWSCHEALAFGRRPVQVTVLRLGWDPRASAATLVDRLFRRQSVRRAPPREEPPPAPSETAVPVADPPPGEALSGAPDEGQPQPHSAPPEDSAPASPPLAEGLN
jgi:hypothetical protein